MVSAGARAQLPVLLSIVFNSVHFIHLPLDGIVHTENFHSVLIFLALTETKF